MNSLAAILARSVRPSRQLVRPFAARAALLAGTPSSAYDRLASYLSADPRHGMQAPTATDCRNWKPSEVLKLVENTFTLRFMSQMVDWWSNHIDEAPFDHTSTRLEYKLRGNRYHQSALQNLGFAAKWCQQQPVGKYSECAGGQHLHAYFSRILDGQGMHMQEQYMCSDPRVYGRSGTGRADLGGHLKVDLPSSPGINNLSRSALRSHRITACLFELKTPNGMESLCKALIQVIMYAQSESMLATLQAHARCFPGVTPWLMLGIGAGPGNLHVFVVSLPALLSLKMHLEARVDPVVKLPMFVLSSPAHEMTSNGGLVSAEELLRGESRVNPYRSAKGLADFVQLTSFNGLLASEWAGVGGMGAEREAEMAMLLEAGSSAIAQRPVLGGIDSLLSLSQYCISL